MSVEQIKTISSEEALSLIKETVSWPASAQSSSEITTLVVNPKGGYRSFTKGRGHQLMITDFNPAGRLQHYCCYRFAEEMAMRQSHPEAAH